jgi:hypothetical protein
VRQVVEEAAATAVQDGRAEVAWAHDPPRVVLTPAAPGAARVVVEVHQDELWWVLAGDGPGTELYVGMEGDRCALLRSLVEAVVAGRYRHGPVTERGRARGWFETFDTEDGPFTSRRFGSEAPSAERRFAPY